jgi:ribosomal protein L16 Arg81 hydroxylase/predicted enzyme related to lactoylglutathione lyase
VTTADVTTGPAVTVTADGPAPPGTPEPAALLHPLTTAAFLDGYWQRRPLHLTGWAGRLAGLFDLAALREVLARGPGSGLLVRVSDDHDGDDGGASAHVVVDAAEAGARLLDGVSVCVDGLDRADARLAAYADRLRRQLGHAGPVAVRCYLSPAGYGFNTHFDAHVVTTLQLEGTKRWRFSRTPAVDFPVDNAFVDDAGEVRVVGRTPGSLRPWERAAVDRADSAEVLLRPGDVLCLPAGTWHEAKAVGGHSLALNVSFSPGDVLSLLADAAATRLRDLASWRAGLPSLPVDMASAREYLTARVQELIHALLVAVDDSTVVSRWMATVRHGPGQGRARGPAAAAVPTEPPATGRRLQCVLGVADATAAADWYRRVLGCEVAVTMPEYGWVELTTPVPGVTLGLTETHGGGGAVLDFGVDDVERMRGVLAANGVTVTEPTTAIAGVARFLLGRDPDGNQLMFFEPCDGTAATSPVEAS